MVELLTEEGLERFGEVAAGHVGEGGIPGLVALVARGDTVHVEVEGSLAVGGVPAKRDSLFRLASTTKPIIGLAALALAQEGLFSLDEPVDRLLPELANRRVLTKIDGLLDETVPARRAITVRELMTFTFGFGMSKDMLFAAEPWPVVAAAGRLHLHTLGPPNPADQPDQDSWMERFASLPLMAQPGDRWFYNTGASVLGVLLARAAGMGLDEVVRTRVLEPLGMRDTAFWATDTCRLATAYGATPDGLEVWDPPEGQWSRPPAFCDGAAGLVSTADDLLALARMLLRGGEPVLREGAVREMVRDQLTPKQRARDVRGFLDGRSWGYCISVVTDGPRAGAYGWDGGLGTTWLVDPARDLTVIVMTQLVFGMARPPQVHADLQVAAYAAVPG